MFVLYRGVYRLLGLVSQIKIPQQGEGGIDSLLQQPWFQRLVRTASRVLPIDRDWVREQSVQLLQQILEVSSKLFASALAGMPKLLVGYFVVTLSFYFFLVDGARFLRFLSNLSPLPHARSMEIYEAFEKSCRGVVIGLFASSLVQAVLMSLFFLFTGLPNVFLMGIVTVVMGMVPVVGSAPIWIGATIYLFLKYDLIYGIIMLVGGILIATSDNVVRPWVMKGHSEIHPLLALVSVFGAVNLMGPTGIFLGPVIAAVFVSFLKILALEIRRENAVGSPEFSV
jgi:predicted PurR-regulated permease PerM